VYSLSIVPELPPAPAARVLDGRAFLTDSLWSAAARRRMADRGPPGGEPARATEVPLDLAAAPAESGPDSGPEVKGEAGRGEDLSLVSMSCHTQSIFLPGDDYQ
jgi:hypothetical protein